MPPATAKARAQGPKLDLRSVHKELYSPSAREVSVVDVPDLAFTVLDGVVPPKTAPGDSEEFGRSIEAMYGIAYGVKFMSKLRPVDPIDFAVMALEGLWWPAGASPTTTGRFRLLMLQPDHITVEMVKTAAEQADAKRPNPLLSRVRLERWREGRCMQIMHVGAYADEGRTIERLSSFAAEHGCRLRGRHHEIYLGDPRRSRPERLRTILRQPISQD